LFLDERGVLEPRPIGDIVENRLRGRVVGFDRDTFEVAFHDVTNWFRELPDKIYEVRLASGRRVHVTAGHNLFTVNAAGDLVKTATRALQAGTRVAIPKWIPDPGTDPPEYRVLDLLPQALHDKVFCYGPAVHFAFRWFGEQVRLLLREAGLSVSYYARACVLPLEILERLHGGLPEFGPDDRFRLRGSGASLPAIFRVDRERAWLLGLYVAEGYRRDQQVIIANTDQAILDRAQAAFAGLGQDVYRSAGAIACCSRLVSALFHGLEMGTGAASKRLPKGSLGWPWQLLDSLLEGLIDGDGSVRPERECLWTTSARLVSDVLLLCARLGKRAVTQSRPARERCLPLHVVSIATNRHKVLTAVPDPFDLLSHIRGELGLTQVQASQLCGFRYPTSLNNVERDRNRGAVRATTLERIHDSYSTVVPSVFNPIGKLTRLVNGDLQWDEVVEVVDSGRFEVVYDLEVRSPDARIQNFLAGYGGIFCSNTAGFIDAAFEGHVTLEISNLANLPVALYAGMRIGQLSFSLMTTPAERPYGPSRGSKYSGQDVPTASRLYLDFQQP
jgi:dCTP deaminase